MLINPIQFQKGLSLANFLQKYGREEQCEAALESACWSNGFVVLAAGTLMEHGRVIPPKGNAGTEI